AFLMRVFSRIRSADATKKSLGRLQSLQRFAEQDLCGRLRASAQVSRTIMSDRIEQIGRYVVQRKLGGGGMGVVYLAHDPVIHRLAAVKVLRTSLDDEEVRQRFAREMRSTGSLVHRNIVTVFDAGEHDGLPFIAMEFVEGRSVAEIVQKGEPLSLDTRLSLI